MNFCKGCVLKFSFDTAFCGLDMMNSKRSSVCVPGQQIHWEPGNQVPTKCKAQANFLIGFMRCRELISLTEGC